MQYVKLTDGLYLVQQDITKSKVADLPKNLNHIFIMDRSGSMYGVIDQLCQDMKERFRKTSVGDTITLGWFSSEGGQFRFVLKGFKITGQDDFKKLDKVIDDNNTTIGMTCFSEILNDTEQVIKDLSALNNSFALCFFTDGYPVVSNYSKELENINKAIAKVAGKVSSSLLVGYGNYYNKELMTSMAEKLGGTLLHQTNLKDFPLALGQFMERARGSEPKILVELHALPHADGAVFSLAGSTVNVHAVENGKIAYAPTKGSTDRVFVLTDKEPKGAVKLSTNSLGNAAAEVETKAAYAAALVLTQRTKTDLAMDVLSALGDVALINQTNNAFTNSEYGAVEQALTEAIGSPQKRFTAGRKPGCLPKPDAFCVLDALDLLMSDAEAEFQPYHPDFVYTKIGVGSKTKDGYPKFEADKESRVPMVDLKWNDTKLNLSILARIKGTIDLPKKSPEGTTRPKNLADTFETNVFRNFTVIKDGYLNTTVLPVAMSKPTYEKLLAEGVIDQEHNRHYKGRVYTLNLDRIPVINRKTAEGRTSAKDLCKASLEESKLMAEIKALKAKQEELDPREQRGLGLNLTPDQEAFLKECGVGKSGFSPPVDKLEATDFYMAKEFEVKIKGLSSLPKVDEVKAKVAAKKTLTLSQELVNEGIKVATSLESKLSGKALVAKLEEAIVERKDKLAEVRSEIQRTKFSVILAKKWFDEFTSRENNVLDVGGNNYTISVREVKVEI